MTEGIQMDGGVGRAVGLLGGEATLQAKVLNTADAHELLLKGLPVASVLHLVSKAPCLEDGDALKRSIGVSLAALRRRKGKISPPRLSCEQSNRCWRFARILGHAIGIFGSEELAAAWMGAKTDDQSVGPPGSCYRGWHRPKRSGPGIH